MPHHDGSSWIGVLAPGICFLGAPLTTYCCQHSHLSRKYYISAGWLLCWIALLVSAFCRTIETLIVTQGLLFGIGLLMIEMPTITILNSWFVKRRGLAYGLLCASTDLFGVAWTYLANALLEGQGIKITFFVFAGISFVVPAITMPFLHERPTDIDDESPPAIPLDSVMSTTQQIIDHPVRRYYKQAVFYTFVATNLFQGLAYYLPFIYLPSYTTALGHSSSTGATILAVANIAQVIGEIGFGELSDKCNVHILTMLSTTVSCVSTFFLWYFASSLGYLIPYAILFGTFGSGLLALWPRMGTAFGEDDANMVFSIISFGRGVTVLASSPISTNLLRGKRCYD